MDDLGGPRPKRIRLTGERFRGGRLPIDSLGELETYQRAIQIMAEQEWRRAHPEEVPPPEVVESASLAIERIEDGSADVFLAFEQHAVYAEYQEQAQDAVDATIQAAYEDRPLPELPAEVRDEVRATVASIGESLEAGQVIQFYANGPESAPTEISLTTRPAATARLILSTFLQEPAPRPDSGVKHEVTSLVARVTVIDAESMKYDLNSEAYGIIHGRYRDNPDMLDELRAVVNSTSEGPLTRIHGDLRYRGGRPWSFWTTTAIERVEFDDTHWGRALTRFASLPTGWAGGDGAQISSTALDASQALLRRVGSLDERPAIAPTEEGGVLLEWTNANGIRSVEILPDGTFELFVMRSDQYRGTQTETPDVVEAARFVRETEQ